MNQVARMQTVEPVRPRDYTAPQLALIKRTVASDCNHDEFDLFVEVSRRVGLDPFRRQIYAIVHSKDKPDKRKLTIITGIDGFRAVAARCGDYRPDDEEPTIVYRDDLKDPEINPLGIERAIVKAFKRAPDGEWHPVVGVAHWDEFAPLKEIWAYSPEEGKKVPTGRFGLDRSGNWARMARVMISKCAEAQALRKGWPEDLSGVYVQEEMDRAHVIEGTATEVVEGYERDERLRKIGGKNTVSILWAAGEPLESVAVGKLADRCIQHIRNTDSYTGLQWWETTNSVGLREFWAVSKSDALEVKKELERRRKELAGAEGI